MSKPPIKQSPESAPELPPEASPEASSESPPDLPPDLPPINEAILDPDTLNQLFEDVSQCTHLIEVIVKQSPRSQTPDANHSLEDAKRMLEDGSVMGIQLRYSFDNAQWWDTLIRTPAGIRIVRIQHDAASMQNLQQ